MKKLLRYKYVKAATEDDGKKADYDDPIESSGDDDDEGLFQDEPFEEVSRNGRTAFKKLIGLLRKCSYPNLGNALNKVLADPKLHKLFSEGFGDGALASVTMSSQETAIGVRQLLPSQNEIGLDNSLKFPLKSDCAIYFKSPVTIVAPIVTYRKSFIIDGHHRWSQLYMINPKAQISAINFNYSDESPYRPLRNFQGAIAATKEPGEKMPSQSAGGSFQNVYAMSEDQIRDYIDKNMQDVCWKSLVKQGVCEDRESAIDYITENAMLLKADNAPFASAPNRDTMPQTDKESIDVAEEGQTNI